MSPEPSLAQLREAGFFDTFYGEAFDAFLEIGLTRLGDPGSMLVHGWL